MGTQKNRLHETVLLSTQNKCLNWWIRKYLQFYAHFFSIWTYAIWNLLDVGCDILCSNLALTPATPPYLFLCPSSTKIKWVWLGFSVQNQKLIFLFLNPNICCGFSKEPYQWEGSFEHPKQMFELVDEKIFTIFAHFFSILTYAIWNLLEVGCDILCSNLALTPATPPYLFLCPSSTKIKWVWSGFSVQNQKLIFLFLNRNICCGYSKEPSQWDGSFEYPKQMFKLMDKKILTIFTHFFLSWPMLYETYLKLAVIFSVKTWLLHQLHLHTYSCVHHPQR